MTWLRSRSSAGCSRSRTLPLHLQLISILSRIASVTTRTRHARTHSNHHGSFQPGPSVMQETSGRIPSFSATCPALHLPAKNFACLSVM